MLLVEEMESGALVWAVGGRERGYKTLFQPNNLLRASGTKMNTGRWHVLG